MNVRYRHCQRAFSRVPKWLFVALATALCAPTARAELTLQSPLLTDGTILQRDRPIVVEGRTGPGQKVSVAFRDSHTEVIAETSGAFQAVLPAQPASRQPQSLVVHSGGEQRSVNNVRVGDVWVCSGQSNMEWPLRNTLGARREVALANTPEVRHFRIPNGWAATPQQVLAGGQWEPTDPAHAGHFSAVAHYFATALYARTGVPQAMVEAHWGGSRIEAWMSAQALGKSPKATARAIVDRNARAQRRAEQTLSRFKRWPGSVVERDPKGSERYRGTQVDESDWATLQAPGLWEKQGFVAVDGVIWYRKTFQLSPGESGQPLTLALGRIDDEDIAWVNGHRVGSTDAYDQLRVYSVPRSALRTGQNSLAIRVRDTGGGGGIYAQAQDLYYQSVGGKKHSLAGAWRVRPEQVTVGVAEDFHHVDTALYNQMIYPLHRTPIRGVIFYQGESNAGNATEAQAYTQQFQRLIESWRASWQQPTMPFYWVQLANFESGRDTETDSPWALLRQAQTAALQLPHTGQALALDVGAADNIHPRDKKTVGHRLAKIALHKAYGIDTEHYRGPVVSHLDRRGDAVHVHFASTPGLSTRGASNTVNGFELGYVAKDGKRRYVPASGRLVGNQVVLPAKSSPPQWVRYAWDDNPEQANLQDRTGLPAEPFDQTIESTHSATH